MISIDQLRILQKRVSALVQKYQEMAEENTLLKKKLRSYEQRVSELEEHYSTIQEDQSEMERTILSALEELDKIEEHVTRAPKSDGGSEHARRRNGNLEM